jgi:hypothetical protein
VRFFVELFIRLLDFTHIFLIENTCYTVTSMKIPSLRISAEGKDVLSDLLVELAGFYLISIPGYVMAQEWPRLTITIIFCMLCIRFATQWRKKHD